MQSYATDEYNYNQKQIAYEKYKQEEYDKSINEKGLELTGSYEAFISKIES